MTRATVDEALCQGHTQCQFAAPDLFGLRDEDGHAYVMHDPVPVGMEDLARLAEESCPERAITLIDVV
jgi:ferredoxin